MNRTIEAMARAIVQNRLNRQIGDAEWSQAKAHHATFRAEFATDGRCGVLVCDAEHDARAALVDRGLAVFTPEPPSTIVALGAKGFAPSR